jgi:filamentous hemagglutinin
LNKNQRAGAGSVGSAVNSAHGNEKGNGTTWNETTLDAGQQVTLNSGRDTALRGAQVNGGQISANVGRDLTLSSLQDSDNYTSTQQSAGVGGSYGFGNPESTSVSFSYNRDKLRSSYDSVQQQTGLYAGDKGFDLTVGNHTQLDGAVISSTADAAANRLDTGTLGFSNLDNRADYKTEHQGVSFSSSGSIGGMFLGNAASTVLAGAGGSGHAEGVTQAAVSDGTLVIRNPGAQQQAVSDLSRDVEHANGSIDPIFNKEKEQRRLQTAQLVGDIAAQAMDIATTEGKIAAA